MSVGKMMRRAAAGVSADAGTDLVSLVGWSHAYWTSGTEFLALGLSDTDTVSTWPDEISTADLGATGVNDSTLDEVDTALNNQPSIYMSTTGRVFEHSSTISAMAGAVAVFHQASIGRWHDYQASGGGGRYVMGQVDSSGAKWQIYFGTSAGQTVAGDTSAHLMALYQNSSNDIMSLDNSTIYGPDDYGSSTLTKMKLLGAGELSIAFLGLYDGDPTGDSGWADFTAAVETLYGITMA